MGAVAAIHTLILLGIVAIFIPHTLAGLCVAFLICLGFVRLIAQKRSKQAEDTTTLGAFLNENDWEKL